jgi:hypothetical protein
MTTATLAAATQPTSAPRPDDLANDTLMEAPMRHDTALIQTANGYLLCSVHAEAWQRGGKDVSMWPANEAEIVQGGGVCADCADDFDCDIVTCYRCRADYDESRGDGWCGLCPACADATEPQD